VPGAQKLRWGWRVSLSMLVSSALLNNRATPQCSDRTMQAGSAPLRALGLRVLGLRRLGLPAAAVALSLCILIALGAAPRAGAAEVSCPNANPIVNENNCMGEGTTANRAAIENYSDNIGGFSTQTSYSHGENVALKIGTSLPSFPSTKVNVAVYRIGYYGGTGARLIPGAGANNVAVNNTQECNPMNMTTGEYSCSNWNVTYTVPGAALPISGIYEAVFTDVADGGIANYVVFTVREDSRASDILYVLPDATYEAYNTWGGALSCKSLYFDRCGGPSTISGDGRAVAVSFDRPLAEGDDTLNHFFGVDASTVQWLEEQGYSVTYTDDIQTDVNPAGLLNHKVDLISGHSEYWSHASFQNFKAARDAGVSILSLSANTAYWQTRYENNHRTLVCYKTIQGATNGNPAGTPNDPASIGPKGEFLPQFATTTRRDPGASKGNPDAPPEGRVGPNEPENSLFGVMYVGDNDSTYFRLAIPAGNSNGEFASNSVWRNSGLSTTTPTTLPESIVGWEWDQIPTQPGYLTQEPAGVKQVTLTDTTNPEDSWLQDPGRERASSPPPGEPSNVSAVEYRAPSGALVFATGTMEWAAAFDVDPVIEQATYNVLSEMGVQPVTPGEHVKVDPSGPPKLPRPAFTATPSLALVGQPIAFNAAASSDPFATITDYKWDLDGSGTFATDTGATPELTHTFTQPGIYKVVLKVTDSAGQQDTTQRTVTVANPVTAAIAATMNPVGASQAETFSGAGSADLNGSIVDYRWDLDGNGTYETDTGATPTVKTSFATTGTHTVGLQVIDNRSQSATTSIPVTVVTGGVSKYSDAVGATPGLLHFYRFDEPSGLTFADSKGTANGTLLGATLGVPGAVNGDPGTAVSVPGVGDEDEGQPGAYGAVPMDLSSQSTVTVEFWMKWNTYGNNDALAMEFTPNFNEHAGGFIVDPNAPEFGGTFAVGIGVGASRNNVFFARPSAGVWHHYAFVLDPTQPAATEITPYVDGQAVSYQKESSGTGAGPFANSTLYLFSRAGATLFGSGSLDELALYSGALGAARVQEHFDANGPYARPVASLANSPSLPRAGQTVTLEGAGSHYSGGSIVKYEWDLNGDGTYETNTGATPKATTSFPNPGTYTVGLRVTDSDGGIDYTTRQISVGNFPPVAHVTASPNPVLTGQPVKLDASGSTDQGTIVDYKWDLDNSGNFATDTGSTPTVTTSFATPGTHTVGVQLTDNEGLTTKTTLTVTVLEQGVSDYEDAVLNTPGLLDYYKLSEPAGPTIHDSKGSANGTVTGGTFGLPGAVQGDSTTAIGFNGSSDSGAIPLNLSGTGELTVEFWLKWNQYANNDALAMEFTPNFNENPGGFLVDPNAPEFGGTFGVGIGTGASRNSIFFARPSAGVWHHYAIAVNTAAPAGSEITPYVDGQPVSFQQESNGTGAGKFANSTLYLMSRAGGALFGNGSLDQLAIYGQPLSAATIFQHYNSYGTNRPPNPSFTLSPNPVRPEQSVTLDASSSTDPDAQIVDYQWDLNGDGTFETDSGSNPTLTTSYPTAGTYKVAVRVIDANGASAIATHTLTVGNLPPVVHVTASPNPALTGQPVKLDASGSTDQGTIVDYKWDLDNSGNYATDTGSTPTVTTSFPTFGTHTVGVQATNDHGLSSRTTIAVTVLEQGVSNYPEAVQGTPGLTDFYKLGEPSGPTIADSKGSSNGTISGGTFGLPGAVQGEAGTAIGFNGSSDSGAIGLNLSGTSKLTVEFWLKWNQYSNNEALAMEFTPNSNENAGGFIVDPNASQFGGTFGVSIGTEGTRNSVFFARPSAGVWHHYAIVLDTTQPAEHEITPYVDGQPVSVQQEAANIGQGPFANSTLYLMSRAGSSLFGAGALQYLAIYNQPLSAATIFQHYNSHGTFEAPNASLTVSPNPARPGQNVTFNASGSTDPDAQIVDYQWDPNGGSNYTVDTGANPTYTTSFPTTGTYKVSVRVIDAKGASAGASHAVTIENPPSAPVVTLSEATGNTFVNGATAYTNPQSGNSGGFTAAATVGESEAAIKSIAFPALTGFSSGGGTVTLSPYQTAYTWSGAGATASGPQTVTATDVNEGTSSSNFTVVPDTTPPTGGALAVNGTAASAGGSSSNTTTGSFAIGLRTDYVEAQSAGQSGLASSTLTVASASVSNNVCGTFGAPTTIVGAPAQTEPTGCYRYTLTGLDNVGNSASVLTTVIVDTTPPSTPTLSFSGFSRNAFYGSAFNTVYFSPSGTGEFAVTAASTDPDTGIASYTFSSLAANGFTQTQSGAKDVYAFGTSATAPGTAATVLATNNAGASSSTATFKLAADTTAPTGGALKVNTTTATAEGSVSYSKTGSFGIGLRTDYAEAQSAGQSGLASSTLTVASASVANNVCGTFGAPVTIVGAPAQTEPTGCYRYTLTGLDNVGNSASVSTTVIVDTTPPSTPTLSFSGFSRNAFYGSAFNTIYFSPSGAGEFAATAASTDPDTGIASYTFSSLAANGFTQTQSSAKDVYAFGTSATQPSAAATALATNNAGLKSATAGFKVVSDTAPPTGGALTVNATSATAGGSVSYNKTGSFTIGTRTNYSETQSASQSGLASSTLTLASAPLTNNACGTFGAPTTLTGNPSQSGLTEGCYRYTLTGLDNVANSASVTTTVEVDKTPPAPTVSVPARANGAVAVTFGATDVGAGVNFAAGQLKRAAAPYTPATDVCGTFGAFANIGPIGPSSPFADSTAANGQCYEYEYTAADLAGNSATSAVSGKVKVDTTGPTLTSITDNAAGTTAGLPQVGDVVALHFSDFVAPASIPASVTITYTREATGSTTIAIAGIGTGSWSTGDAENSHFYSKVGGTSATVTATTAVESTVVKLTVTKVTDPSGNLTAGGPGSVSGSLSSSVQDVFGNPASTSQFKAASVKLF
jgi:PKD repeat protein